MPIGSERNVAVAYPSGQKFRDQGQSYFEVDEENAGHEHHEGQSCGEASEDGEGHGEEEEEWDNQPVNGI